MDKTYIILIAFFAFTTVSYSQQGNRYWYRDNDGDGIGGTATIWASYPPSGYVYNTGDCDDNNFNVGGPSTWYRDADGDGQGSATNKQTTCFQYPNGYVANNNDIDDSNALITNIPPQTWYFDNDGDGFGVSGNTRYQSLQPDGYANKNGDCADSNVDINPDTIWYSDLDGDGLGDPNSPSMPQCNRPSNYVANSSDNCPDYDDPTNECDTSVIQNTSISGNNYIYTRTYQVPMTISPDRSAGNEDMIEQVTYFDGLGRPKQQVAIRAGGQPHPNLISMDSWTLGSGSAEFYKANGSDTENNRVMGTDPYGNQSVLWACGGDAARDADGGWNSRTFPVDRSKAYRYAVWVKRTGSLSNGYAYHGTEYVENLDGSPKSNPYFWSGSLPALGDWYLMVGIVHPEGYTGGDSGLSGVFDINGNRVRAGTDYRWRADTKRTKLRSYLYYSTDVATRQYFWDPSFRRLDGTERGMADLISSTEPSDLVTHIGYDGYGRQAREYLPVPVEDGEYGSFRGGDIAAEVAGYYKAAFPADFNTIDNPYREKKFEASPLNRVIQQASPGTDWALNNGDDRGLVTFGHGANGPDEVLLYRVGFTGGDTEMPYLEGGTAHYVEGELYKNTTRDENHDGSPGMRDGTAEEFTDKQGRVVLKRTYENEVAHDTYYVYDDFGNLTFVIPPLVDTDDGVGADELDNLCYRYKYDGRNRLIEKKLPGKGWEYIVYDKLDHPIMTQDANLLMSNSDETKDKWLFTKYDAHGRVAYTGIHETSPITRADLQDLFKDDTAAQQSVNRTPSNSNYTGVPIYYDNSAKPTGMAEIYTINYYDTYLPAGAAGKATIPDLNSYDVDISNMTTGLPTVSRVRVLGVIPAKWITTTTAYDDKGRAVWVRTVNDYLNSEDLTEYELDFTGRVLRSRITHLKQGHEPIVTEDTYTYDHMGRPLKQTQKINDQGAELIANNDYDALGQLESKAVGGTAGGGGLQSVDFSYNVRGWLTGINDPDVLGNDLFAFGVNYNAPLRGDHSTAIPLYNGNISQTLWKTAVGDEALRGYAYEYDALNRLKTAYSRKGDGLTTADNYSIWAIYDKNGNIRRMNRRGAIVDQPGSDPADYGQMDNISYGYETDNKSNRLQWADEIIGGDTGYGFIDGADLPTEYGYDDNGNMTRDDNKGITAIGYNHLNLPTKVTINGNGNNGEISYIYAANGTKLEKTAPNKVTQYAGGHIYENGSLKYFDQPEGYVEPKNGGDYGLGFDYYYQYKDHLDNIRLAYRDDPLRSTRFQQEFEGTTGDWYTQANEVSVSNSGGRLDIAIRRVYFASFEDVDVTPGEPVEVAFDFDKGDMDQVHVSIAEYKNGGWEPFNERDIFYSVQTGRFQTAMTPASDKIRVIIEKGGGPDNGTFTTCHIDNLSVTQTALKVVDVKDYYPFGLEHKGYNNMVNGSENNFMTFNGQELNKSLGLDVMEMTFRQYDPAIGRFNVIDEMTEDAMDYTPYRFGFNNPIFFSDPTGLWETVNGGYRTTDKDEIARLLGYIQREETDVSSKGITNFIKEDIAFFEREGGYNEGLPLSTALVKNGKITDYSVHKMKNEIAYYNGTTNYLYTREDYEMRNKILADGTNDPISRLLLSWEKQGTYQPITAKNYINYVGGHTTAKLLTVNSFMNMMGSVSGGPVGISRSVNPRYLGTRSNRGVLTSGQNFASRISGASINNISSLKNMSWLQFRQQYSHLYRGKFMGRGNYMIFMGMDFRAIKAGLRN